MKERQRSRFGEQEVIRCGRLTLVEESEEWPGWRMVGFTDPNSHYMDAERSAGLHLSLLVMNSSKNTTETLSVHSGEVARSVPLELDVPDLQDGLWLDMEYRDSGLRWEKPMVGHFFLYSAIS